VSRGEPLILEIKGNSLDDGPGIRTVVFFKGCPLDCSWCHNPESKRTSAEMSFDPEACVGCDACLDACGRGALSRADARFIDREKCDMCLECVDACPSGALWRVGRTMSVEEVAREIEKDLPFFRTSGGGATMSGGEPTMFMAFLSRLLARLEEGGVKTIVETCGYFDPDEFELEVLPRVDAVYFDLKILDDELHRRECGVSNARILENFERLTSECGRLGVELLPRVPLIPGVTANAENLEAIAGFLMSHGVGRVALLEYNPLWLEKSAKLGRPSPRAGEPAMSSWMPRSEIEACRHAMAGLEIV
jgi:pyruvate formate lyase activating enzyme